MTLFRVMTYQRRTAPHSAHWMCLWQKRGRFNCNVFVAPGSRNSFFQPEPPIVGTPFIFAGFLPGHGLQYNLQTNDVDFACYNTPIVSYLYTTFGKLRILQRSLSGRSVFNLRVSLH
jgi:hypothetical protein